MGWQRLSNEQFEHTCQPVSIVRPILKAGLPVVGNPGNEPSLYLIEPIAFLSGEHPVLVCPDDRILSQRGLNSFEESNVKSAGLSQNSRIWELPLPCDRGF